MTFFGRGRRFQQDRKRSVRRDAALSALILFGLAAPFLPLPGDRMTRIAVRFQTGDMPAPENFTTRTTHSICTALSAALSYSDPSTGEYVRIDCGRRGSTPAPSVAIAPRASDPVTLADADSIGPATIDLLP